MERVTQEAQGQAGETPAVAPLVDNRYQLVSRLRAEATGAIYQARDTRQGGMVLLQEIPRALSLHFDLYFGEFKRRFHQLQGIRHAAVMLPKGHIYDREQDRHFLLFDYEDSVPLKAYMARQSRGVLAVSDALALCSRIATALDHIHIQGMVHGDLRVANVLLRPAASPGADRRPAEHETLVRGMAVRLSGCALNHEIRSIVLRAAPDLGQPLISTLLAEDAFSSAPERWLSIRASGDSAITTRTLFHDATLRIRPAAPTAASDIYALAELFYTMVTGSQPLAPGHAAMDPATVDALAAIPDLGERGNRLLRQALAPDPARRPKRATAMIHAMEEEMRTQMLSMLTAISAPVAPAPEKKVQQLPQVSPPPTPPASVPAQPASPAAPELADTARVEPQFDTPATPADTPVVVPEAPVPAAPAVQVVPPVSVSPHVSAARRTDPRQQIAGWLHARSATLRRRLSSRAAVAALAAAGVLTVASWMTLWPGSADERSAAELRDLLRSAERDLDAFQVTMASGGNAYEKYRDALQSNPDSEEARKGMIRVAEKYAHLAQVAIGHLSDLAIHGSVGTGSGRSGSTPDGTDELRAKRQELMQQREQLLQLEARLREAETEAQNSRQAREQIVALTQQLRQAQERLTKVDDEQASWVTPVIAPSRIQPAAPPAPPVGAGGTATTVAQTTASVTPPDGTIPAAPVAPAMPAAPATKTGYAIQVGAFIDSRVATSLGQKINTVTVAGAPLTAFYQSADVRGQTYHRVRVGPFATREEADRAIRQLQQDGMAGFILSPGGW